MPRSVLALKNAKIMSTKYIIYIVTIYKRFNFINYQFSKLNDFPGCLFNFVMCVCFISFLFLSNLFSSLISNIHIHIPKASCGSKTKTRFCHTFSFWKKVKIIFKILIPPKNNIRRRKKDHLKTSKLRFLRNK